MSSSAPATGRLDNEWVLPRRRPQSGRRTNDLFSRSNPFHAAGCGINHAGSVCLHSRSPDDAGLAAGKLHGLEVPAPKQLHAAPDSGDGRLHGASGRKQWGKNTDGRRMVAMPAPPWRSTTRNSGEALVDRRRATTSKLVTTVADRFYTVPLLPDGRNRHGPDSRTFSPSPLLEALHFRRPRQVPVQGVPGTSLSAGTFRRTGPTSVVGRPDPLL